MDFRLTEEQVAIRDMARAFAGEQIAPHAAEWDATETFPVETLRAAAALGLAGINCREDVGGAGLGRIESVLIFEELASACPSTAAYLSIHNMAVWMIDHYGTDGQRERFLPKLLTMEHFASYCLTEPDAGSDAASLRTRAQREGDYYRVTGEKAFISGGSVSDIYVCMVRTGAQGPKGVSCVVVENETPGLSFGRLEKKLGWHSQPTAAVIFDDCRVPVENRLGEEGEGFSIAMQGLDGGRLNIGACSIGGARSALDAARAHMGQRVQFGRPLADFDSLRFRFADMVTDLEAARLMLHRAAWMHDCGMDRTTAAVAMAKRLATDVGFDVANQALQLHGGYGYLMSFPIERLLRDLRVHQILEGTNEIMRLIIARDELGR